MIFLLGFIECHHIKQKQKEQKLGFWFVHLGELVGCSTSDLGYAEESERRFEILELGQKVGL